MQLDLNRLWTLLPTQRKFLEAISRCQVNETRAIAYVGAMGSGKTWALCRGVIGLALAYPGMKILVGRHHSTDLRDTTKSTFFELIAELETKIKEQYPPEVQDQVPPVGEMFESKNDFVFSNGSQILFRPLDEAEKKYKSLNVSAIAVDEASEVDLEAIQMLVARRRQLGYPLLLIVVSNPTGYTHWLYKWFVKDRQENYELFRTNSYENQKNLPASYIQELTRRYPIDWVKRYVEGEWGGLTEGLPVYGGLFEEATHVKLGKYHRGIPVWVGVDFGWASPAVVWAQSDRYGRCQILREWTPKALDTYKLAQGIITRNGMWFPSTAKFEYFCGHDGNQHAPSAEKTGIEIMTDAGLPPSWRYHHQEAGFTVIRNMLKLQDDDKPNLVVDPSCDLTIESFLGEYKYKPDSDKVLKDEIHDPVMDAFRYIAYQNYNLAGLLPQASPAKLPIFGERYVEDDLENEVIRVKGRTLNTNGWRRGATR